MDIFTNCLGFIAIVENDQLIGYNIAVGGGMGRSHGNVQTFPRLADVIGFFTPDKLVDVAKAVLTIIAISATALTANTRVSNMSSPSVA